MRQGEKSLELDGEHAILVGLLLLAVGAGGRLVVLAITRLLDVLLATIKVNNLDAALGLAGPVLILALLPVGILQANVSAVVVVLRKDVGSP